MISQEFAMAPAAAPGAPEAQPRHGFFHHLIVGNYFYFISAALMLAGCYHKMHALIYSTDAGPKIFDQTLKTLYILQRYELLVIAASLLIVWRLRRLDDAFSLLLIELLLLLDPTFFTNAFFTMYKTENTLLSGAGVTVNLACLALVPLKLAILLWGVRLRLSRGCWGAYLFAAAFAYLAEAPLCRRVPLPGFSPAAYHYLLSWAPLVFVGLLPPLRRMVTARSAAEGFVSPGRLLALGVALLAMPLTVIFAHLIESLRVHDMFLYPFELAPVCLAAAVLAVRQTAPGQGKERRLLYVCDLCALAALAAAAVRRTALEDRAVLGYAAQPLPGFAAAHVPLILTALAVAGLYAWIWRRYACRAALYRIAGLALAGVAAGICSLEITRALAGALWLGLRKGGAAVLSGGAHAAHGLGAALASCGHWIAGIAAHVWHWVAGIAAYLWHWVGGICTALWGWAAPALFWIGWLTPELIQAALLALLVIDRRRKAPRLSADVFATLVFFILLIGLVRYGMVPAKWSAAICLAEFGGLVAWGLPRGRRGHLVFAAIQGAIFICVSLANDTWLAHVLMRFGDRFGDSLNHWLDAHPMALLWVLWAATLGLSIRFRRPAAWLPLGLLTIWLASGWLPRGREYWVPEILEAVFVLGLALDHRFNPAPGRGARYFISFLVAVAALSHYGSDPGKALGAIVVVQILALIAAATLLQHPGYLFIGALQAVVFTIQAGSQVSFDITPATLVIDGGLTLFALGLVVTFNKARLLHWGALAGAWWERLLAMPAIPMESPEPHEPPAPPQASAPEVGPPTAAVEPDAAPPSTPPAPVTQRAGALAQSIREREAAHLHATLDLFFNSAPDYAVALRRDLPPETLQLLDATAREELTALAAMRGQKTVYLIKGDLASRDWTMIPAWICYPEERAGD